MRGATEVSRLSFSLELYDSVIEKVFLQTVMVDASSQINTNTPPSKFAFRNTSLPKLGISLEQKIQM